MRLDLDRLVRVLGRWSSCRREHRLLTFAAGERASCQAEGDSQANANGQLMCYGPNSCADADANGEPHANLHGLPP